MGDMEENEQKWDKLNIKPVTQQYVHFSKSNRYALIDLYFRRSTTVWSVMKPTTRITSSKMPHAKSTCKQHCPPAAKTD